MASSRLASNLTEDYLTCVICYEIYKDPRKLHCDHTFCFPCLTDYSKKYVSTASLPCPICRQETKQEVGLEYEKWINELPRDTLLVAILKTVNEFQILSPSCAEEDIVFHETKSKKALCNRHQEQEMDVYCFTHAQELCSECAWIDHKECECCSLDESGERVEEQMMKLKERLDQIHIHVNDIQRQGTTTVTKVTENKNKALLSLNNVQEILQEFWAKAQYSIQHVAQSIHERERNMNKTLSSAKLIQEDLEGLTTELGDAGQTKNKSEKLKFLNEADVKASNYEKDLLGLSYQLRYLPSFMFEENEDLVSFCKGFKETGKIIVPLNENADFIDSVSESSDIVTSPSVARSPSNCRFASSEDPTLGTDDAFFENFSHRVVHVGENSRGIYTISGICIVGDFVVIVDQYNNLLLKYDLQQGVYREMLKIEEPHQLSLIPQSTEVMVTSWSKECIYTVETCPKFVLQKPSLRTPCHYIGIQVLDKHRILVTSTNKTIDILSFDGTVLHKIRPKAGIFSSNPILLPAHAARLSDDTVIVFDSVKKALAAMDLSGKIRWWKNVSGLSGFTCANGMIYACLRKANVIMTLTPEGKIKDERFLSKNIGIKRPWAIDVRDGTLAVTEDSPSGKFHVVNMKFDNQETLVKEIE